jgi:hypothetical protein
MHAVLTTAVWHCDCRIHSLIFARTVIRRLKQPHSTPQKRIGCTMFRFIFRLIAMKAAARVIGRLFASRTGAAAGRSATRVPPRRY